MKGRNLTLALLAAVWSSQACSPDPKPNGNVEAATSLARELVQDKEKAAYSVALEEGYKAAREFREGRSREERYSVATPNLTGGRAELAFAKEITGSTSGPDFDRALAAAARAAARVDSRQWETDPVRQSESFRLQFANLDGRRLGMLLGGGTKRDIPAVVAVNGGELCSGVLVDKYHVLTACHCLPGQGDNTKIWVHFTGQTGTISPASTAKAIFKNPGLDVAVLRLDDDAPDDIDPMCIAAPFPELTSQTVVKVAGFGASYDGGAGTERAIDVMFVEACTGGLFGCDSNDHGCGQGQFMAAKAGRGACAGDSGGPVFIEGPNRPPLLIGIVPECVPASATNCMGGCPGGGNTSACCGIGMVVSRVDALNLPEGIGCRESLVSGVGPR